MTAINWHRQWCLSSVSHLTFHQQNNHLVHRLVFVELTGERRKGRALKVHALF